MEKKNAWYEEIDASELPEPYHEMSMAIGIQHTLEIAKLYQGTGMYLPRLDKTLNKIRDKKMRGEFNGTNYKELAIKYGITERWVREILSNNYDSSQMSIFDVS
jgi:Mor family transcriptional regulator